MRVRPWFILVVVAALLFCGGGFAGTKAALTYFSNDYTAGFELDHLQVHLIENENDVCCGENESIYTVHRTNDKVAQEKIPKYKGDLVGYLGYKNENKLKTPFLSSAGGNDDFCRCRMRKNR